MTRKGEAPLAQIAKDFGLSVTTLKRWIAIAELRETGAGPAPAKCAEMRGLKKRNRLLEQENEILRRLPPVWQGTSTQNDVLAGHGSCRRRDSRGGDLQGAGIQQARLLPVEIQSGHRKGLGRACALRCSSRYGLPVSETSVQGILPSQCMWYWGTTRGHFGSAGLRMPVPAGLWHGVGAMPPPASCWDRQLKTRYANVAPATQSTVGMFKSISLGNRSGLTPGSPLGDQG